MQMPPQVWQKKKDCKIHVATNMQMPKGDRGKPTIHRHSQSDDPTGISAKGLAPTGITSGYLSYDAVENTRVLVLYRTRT